MITCPRCGFQNGKRLKDSEPIKCSRCWYQFIRDAGKPPEDQKQKEKKGLEEEDGD